MKTEDQIGGDDGGKGMGIKEDHVATILKHLKNISSITELFSTRRKLY